MKTYGEIKASLQDRIDIYRRQNPHNTTRTNKIHFLSEVMNVLDELEHPTLTEQSNDGIAEVAPKKPKSSGANKGKQHQPAAKKSSSPDEHGSANMHAKILIGAMSLVCEAIEEPSSLLRNHLQAIIHEQALSPSGLNQCYSLLNVFFNNTLFETNPHNLQRIMKAEHKLNKIPLQSLKQYIERGYLLEARSAPAADTSALPATGPIAASSTSIPVIIQQTFLDYGNLLKQYDNLLKAELVKHHVATIAELPVSRAPQYKFLTYIINALKNSNKNDNEKMAILAGAMSIVRASISQEYNTNLTLSVESNSSTHEILSATLKSDTTPLETVDFLLSTTYEFIMDKMRPNPDNACDIPADIQENLPSLLELAQQTIASNRISVLKKEMKRVNKEHAKAERSTSVIGAFSHMLWGSEKKSEKKPDDSPILDGLEMKRPATPPL